MKLSTWANENGLSYRTAHRLFKAGKLPVSAIQLETGTIILQKKVVQTDCSRVVVYCRVSSHNKKDDLDCQVVRCLDYASAKGYQVDKVYKEIASGMNDKRTKLVALLDSKPTVLIVENKDRLTRFGFNYLSLLLGKLNCRIDVIHSENNDEADLMKDLISIITSFCCRLYGMRRGYKKAKEIHSTL